MIRLLKAFVQWAEKRWPEKVIVTTADYLVLKAQIDTLSKIVTQHAEYADRLKKIEEQMSKLNLVLGVGSGAAMLER